MTRYFAQNTPRAGLEHMMMSVPGFQKRGGGMMILSRFCYKPEDVDCRYCLHYRRRSCQVRTCPYIAERLKSGAIEYLDLILEYFGHIPHAGLHKRIQAVEHWSGPDQAVLHTVSVHLRSRFADRVWDDAPPGYLAALYLLASKERLWQPALPALSHDSIDFSRIVSKPHGFAIQDYPIFYSARRLYDLKSPMEAEDLAHPKLVSDLDFHNIIYATMIARYGKAVMDASKEAPEWALREYPTSTDEQAILRHLGEMDGVTIRIYTRQVTPSEERRIIHNAANKHRMSRSSTEDLQQTVTAEANLQDVVTLVSSMHRNREPLLHCAVFLELTAPDYDALKLLQTDVLTELVRSKLNVDRLMLRQQEGFVSVMPAGRNAFGAQFERVLPASSVANLYPFNYSGKTDPHGFYIGKDKYGANILVDFDKRDDDKTSANILILGNSGQGKSYLLKLLLLNFLEAGKSVISLDVEHEQKDMCETVGGCFMDLMGGVYRINPLEPKCWDDGSGPEDRDAPEAFRKSTRLSQHISFLKDFFRAYKDFSDRHIDAIEIMVGKLYAKWGISDSTNFAGLKPQDYPILSDLYKLIEQEYREYDGNCHQLYTAELLQEILLGLHSMCQGAEAQFFNGHTNVTSSRFIVFGVKGLLQASKNVRGAMLFNILSYMSDRLLTIGNTTAALDELYVWLSDNVSVGTTIIEYIRNTLKRVRKKESNLIMASQNLEDFDREGIRELTKPLFAIPPHQFIFNCGSIDKRFYMDLLQLEEAEYNLIRFPQRGVCLFKCGNERYLLEVHAPAYKEALFGTAGGR